MKQSYRLAFTVFIVLLFGFSIHSCGGRDGGADLTTNDNLYTIGGTVTRLTGSGLVLQNNGGDDLTITGLNFEFATALPDGSAYNVTVLTQPMGQCCSVVDGKGIVSGENVTDVTVSCDDGCWGTAVSISQDVVYVGDPQISIDAAGNAIAVWEQDNHDMVTYYSDIWANRFTTNSGWETAAPIHDLHTVNQPQIATDASGNALAVWQQYSPGIFQFEILRIWANRYTADIGWGIAEVISDEVGPTYRYSNPQISTDADGNALAVWSQGDVANIWANRYTVNRGWGTAVPISLDGACYNPQIATDAAGNAIVVWKQYAGDDRYSVWANRYTTDSGWDTAAPISESANAFSWFDPYFYPRIAMDAAGNALVVWNQYEENYGDSIWANRYTTEGGWSTAAQISEYGVYYNPQIATDAAGNALAVWEQHESEGSSTIWAIRYIEGSGWDTAELISEYGAYFHPQISTQADGNALAVWEQHDSEDSSSIWAIRYIKGSGWGTAVPISPDVGPAFYPKIATDTIDNALVIWVQEYEDSYVEGIWANRFE